MLERFYHSHTGICFNYLVERWWKNKFFLYKRIIGEYKAVYWLDFLLVVTYLGIFLGLLAYAGNMLMHTSVAETILLGFIVPFIYSRFVVGMSVYQQHTHGSILWFNTEEDMEKLGRLDEITMHVRFPQWYNRISHNVMEHTAHHVDPRIPLYKLAKAMATISFSLTGFLETMARCKLYDYENNC